MKNILARQIILILIFYAFTKLLWDSIPIEKLPEILRIAVNDLFGPLFLISILSWLFIHIFWKIPILDKLTQFLFGTKPNLQGTWSGKLIYEWDSKKSEKNVFLVIEQANGYSLDIWLLTDERTSSSIFTDIMPYRSGNRIIYTYSNEESPNNRIKNPSHEGFCQLDIVNASNNLKGIYYTTRKTFGEMTFDKRNKKIILDFKNAQKLFGIE
jgi:hypothetical protein